MKKAVVIIFLNITFTILQAQNFVPDLSAWDSNALQEARGYADHSSATERSNDVVFFCNLARTSGALFVETVLRPYLNAKGDTRSSKYKQSLIARLNTLNKQTPLRHEANLIVMAKSYANYAGGKGIVGHARFKKRFAGLVAKGKTVGENCSYGMHTALDVVIQLLIDEGVPDLGHRNNILGSDFTNVGVAFAKHKKYSINAVMEFSN